MIPMPLLMILGCCVAIYGIVEMLLAGPRARERHAREQDQLDRVIAAAKKYANRNRP